MHTSNTLTLSTFLTTSENKLSHKVQWHGAGVAVTDTRIHLFFLPPVRSHSTAGCQVTKTVQ